MLVVESVRRASDKGSRSPNFQLNQTKTQFENHLSKNGFDKKTVNTPKGDISIFSKNGEKSITTRDFSTSTGGASGEIFKQGKAKAKIRFKEKK